VVLQEQDRTLQGMNRPFCFEAAWFGHDNFTSFIQENWKHGADLPHALEVMTAQLKRWNKDVFGNIFMRKERVLAGLGGVQQALAVKGNSYLNRLENQLLTEYHQIYLDKRRFIGTRNQGANGSPLGIGILPIST
jgi:hypothetical protein